MTWYCTAKDGVFLEEDWHRPGRSWSWEADPSCDNQIHSVLWQGSASASEQPGCHARRCAATFYHAIYTDETPQHDRCPVGDDSWCFYQKALATGQEPGPHRTNVGTPLSVDVAVQVKAVYEQLSTEASGEEVIV